MEKRIRIALPNTSKFADNKPAVMDLEFILKKLKEQETCAQYSNLDTWLPTTYQYIEDYFKSYSERASNFKNLIREYENKKINSKNSSFGSYQFTDIKNKAGAFLKEIIEVLEHEHQLHEKARLANLENLKRQQEHLTKLATAPKPQTKPVMEQKPLPQPEPKVIYKTRLPFGMNVVKFWGGIAGILISTCTFFYWLGTRWETFDLHEQNRELKEQIKSLKEDTTTMGKKIREPNIKTANFKEGPLIVKDSLPKN